jgi:hypothetical protein
MIVHETDWLGYNSVFYNEKTCKVSSKMLDVVDLNNINFNACGLFNYINYGFSVFGFTPIEGVKFTLPNTALRIENGSIIIDKKPDPVLNKLDIPEKSDDVIEKLRAMVNEWETANDKTIVIPTSSGYDSRLLNSLINNKSRIHSFSYGISPNQKESCECLYAKKLSEILNTKWDMIELGEFHKYIHEWFMIFGVSTHLHGMYHMEFYNKIKDRLGLNVKILSGIVGDIWSGNLNVPEIKSPNDVFLTSYNHGVNADSRFFKFKPNIDLHEQYYEENKENLKNYKFRIIESMRRKIILLRYLLLIPSSLGLETWSPFIDMDIAISMLNIPQNERNDRIWQRNHFIKNNINLNDMGINCDNGNCLDLYAERKFNLPKLNQDILSTMFNKNYLDHIESTTNTYEGYSAKVTLLPIQMLHELTQKQI